MLGYGTIGQFTIGQTAPLASGIIVTTGVMAALETPDIFFGIGTGPPLLIYFAQIGIIELGDDDGAAGIIVQ